MVDWYGNRHNEKYTYRRVSWEDWTEHEEYGFITSGSIELSSNNDLKVMGSFSFEGKELPDTKDLMRIYYSFQDDAGNKEEVPVATLFVSYAEVEHVETNAGIKSKGDLNGLSVLSVLEDEKYGQPYTITRNTNAIYKAQEMVRHCGLNVEFTPSIRVIATDHTFAAGTSYLEMVNWLCDASGYTDAYPDAMGTVQLQPYDTIQRRSGGITFVNDERSIMYPEVSEENEINDTCNVVKLLYNTDAACIVAEAKNLRGSRASLEARGGREKTLFEEIGEIDENGSKLTNLVDLAETKLRDESCDVEYVTISHAYIPIYPFDPVTIKYADLEWSGNAENISVSFSPSTKTQTKVKRVLYDTIEVEKSGRVLRGRA